MKERFFTIKEKIKTKLHTHKKKMLTEAQLKRIAFFNRYSLLFHMLLSLMIVFAVELISRRSLTSTLTFVGAHTFAYLYNAFIVFASLTLVYFFRRRAFFRIIISGFWLLLGIINGCILSNRVTPFGYTDLKCISDLLSMSNTSYFTAREATCVVIGLSIFFLFCLVFFVKGPRYAGKMHYFTITPAIACLMFIAVPITTQAAQSSNLIASYFSNIAQGYENYGFIYGFSSSVVDRGMSKPENYSEQTIADITASVDSSSKKTTLKKKSQPNVILILLESFCDPDEINFLEYNEDPIPTFHSLEENYSTGYLTVPVVGAGTANTEFEILSGMSLQYFGTGEYPYKTILKKTDCESVASALSSIGYGTHAVHNNGGNFYSRVNAFSMMGFDSFTSKELMDIQIYTPTGSWPTDDILIPETIKTLDSTPDQADFTYTITVGTHGDYPPDPVIEDPPYTVSGIADEGKTNSWTYYVNLLHATDVFLANLIEELDKRDEDTILIAYGDHLPTMGLSEEDMLSGDIYKTNYVTWNNFGLEKEDADLYAYQLMPHITDTLGIHEGTVMKYHQTQSSSYDQETYLEGLNELQYDILYGRRYCYGGQDPYPATDIVMGIDDVTFHSFFVSEEKNTVCLRGNNFTKWSKAYVNGNKISTRYIDKHCVEISLDALSDGDEVFVAQVGSSSTIFRSSNTLVYEEPEAVLDTEAAASYVGQ